MKKLLILFLLLFVVACSNDNASNEVEADGWEQEDEELRELTAQKAELESEIQELLNRSNEVTKNIKEKELTLEQLEGTIEEKEEEPIELSPGYYYFGEHVTPGRYKLMAQEGHTGNVYVEDAKGFTKVGVNFGDGEYSVEDYVFNGLSGEELNADIPIILQPVE